MRGTYTRVEGNSVTVGPGSRSVSVPQVRVHPLDANLGCDLGSRTCVVIRRGFRFPDPRLSNLSRSPQAQLPAARGDDRCSIASLRGEESLPFDCGQGRLLRKKRARATRLFGWAFDFSRTRLSAHTHRPAASGQAALFEKSRRRTWPFHIHNPERTITGRKTYRVGGA
jgi:hypothetical protein